MLCCLAHDSRVTVSALFLSEETYQNQGLWLLFYYKDIYLEVGSAKTGSSRREFTRLLDDCNSQQIEVMVVKSLSRFGRDNVEVIESIRALVSAGVTIYFMEEDIDVDASYPEWELSLRSAVNQ